jgi:hypothetical protein
VKTLPGSRFNWRVTAYLWTLEIECECGCPVAIARGREATEIRARIDASRSHVALKRAGLCETLYTRVVPLSEPFRVESDYPLEDA